MQRMFLYLAVILVTAAWTLPASLEAQTPPPGVNLQELMQRYSPEEIVRRLEESGLTRAQVRDRLRRAGYDPSLADPYFDAIESGEIPGASGADAAFLEALQGIGVTLREDSLGMAARPGLSSSNVAVRPVAL